MELSDWNRCLLLGSLLIVVAGMALVSGRQPRDRLLAVGILVQGIAITFVAGGLYFPRADLEIAAAVILPLCGLWTIWALPDRNSADAPTIATATPASSPALASDPPKTVVDPAPDVSTSAHLESKVIE